MRLRDTCLDLRGPSPPPPPPPPLVVSPEKSARKPCCRLLITSTSCRDTVWTTSLRFCSSPSGHWTNLVWGGEEGTGCGRRAQQQMFEHSGFTCTHHTNISTRGPHSHIHHTYVCMYATSHNHPPTHPHMHTHTHTGTYAHTRTLTCGPIAS